MTDRLIARLHEDKQKRLVHVFSERGYELTVPLGFRHPGLRVGRALDTDVVDEIRLAGRAYERARDERREDRRTARAERRPTSGTISELRPGRRDSLYVYLDGSYAFAATPGLIEREDLRVGRTLEAAEVTRLAQAGSIERVAQIIDKLFGYRLRTAGELRDRLTRKGIDPGLAEAAIALRVKSGQIPSDLEFARAWAVSRGIRRGKGIYLLIPKLRELRVSAEAIETVKAEFDRDSAASVALAKAARGLDLGDERERRRFVNRVTSRGFNYGDAKRYLEGRGVADEDLDEAVDEEDRTA